MLSLMTAKKLTNTSIKELISRRRRQILVHSIIYYRLNDNLIPDSTWAAWAVELKQLQDQYPEIAKQCCYADAYKDFDPSTGYNLPLYDEKAISVAHHLINYRDKKGI